MGSGAHGPEKILGYIKTRAIKETPLPYPIFKQLSRKSLALHIKLIVEPGNYEA